MKSKQLRKQIEEVRRSIDLVKRTDRQARLRSLQKAIKAAGNTQTGRALSLLEARERSSAEMADAREGLARIGNEQSQARAILNASAPAISNAQRPLGPSPGRTQRQTLRGPFDGSYRRLALPPQEIELPSLRRDHELETKLEDGEITHLTDELDKALSSKGPNAMQRVEAISFQLSKVRLRQGHRRGEI